MAGMMPSKRRSRNRPSQDTRETIDLYIYNRYYQFFSYDITAQCQALAFHSSPFHSCLFRTTLYHLLNPKKCFIFISTAYCHLFFDFQLAFYTKINFFRIFIGNRAYFVGIHCKVFKKKIIKCTFYIFWKSMHG